MAIAERDTHDKLLPILEQVARALGRLGVKEGKAEGAVAPLRVELEEGVNRVVQVYWTGFQASIPGRCIGLHLEVAEPRVHWAEAYLNPDFTNWVFTFAEREDGEMQLTYHRDYPTPEAAIEGFFNLSGWYVLTATDKQWSDVVYEVSDRLPWSGYHGAIGGAGPSDAVQESLKKSTILWLRWRHDGTERTMPVWFLYDNKTSKIYVLSGERQQTLPGAAQMRAADVILRWKMKNAQVAEIPAFVRVLEPGDEWDEVAEKIAEKRLNIPGLPEETARRWRDECVILELTLRT
jgi:hypothetical protein